MNWFLWAILGPILWSASNHIDKFLLNKKLKGVGKEALIMYSTLFGLVILPLAYFFDPKIFSISLSSIFYLILAGWISSIAIYLYLYALENEETSIVMPFFQTIPIFGFILGFLFLKESLSAHQILGSIIVILGSLLLSIEINVSNKIGFKSGVVFLTLGSSLAFATYETLFKVVAVEDGFWVSTFWQYFGLFIFGLILFIAKKKHRSDFLHLLQKHDFKFLTINILNESLTIAGNMCYNFALILAPIAVVMSIAGYQPIFVFIGGVILTKFFPKIAKEDISYKNLIQKIIATTMVLIGTIVIYN
jgi:drug/metabolite transporter (DMT)-like permease